MKYQQTNSKLQFEIVSEIIDNLNNIDEKNNNKKETTLKIIKKKRFIKL